MGIESEVQAKLNISVDPQSDDVRKEGKDRSPQPSSVSSSSNTSSLTTSTENIYKGLFRFTKVELETLLSETEKGLNKLSLTYTDPRDVFITKDEIKSSQRKSAHTVTALGNNNFEMMTNGMVYQLIDDQFHKITQDSFENDTESFVAPMTPNEIRTFSQAINIFKKQQVSPLGKQDHSDNYQGSSLAIKKEKFFQTTTSKVNNMKNEGENRKRMRDTLNGDELHQSKGKGNAKCLKRTRAISFNDEEKKARRHAKRLKAPVLKSADANKLLIVPDLHLSAPVSSDNRVGILDPRRQVIKL